MNKPGYEDYLQSETATRLGIDNAPGPEQERNIRERLMPLVDEIVDLACGLWPNPFPADLINSGFRGEKLNAAIPGASRTSAHCHGLAVDIAVDKSITLMDLGDAIEKAPAIMKKIDQLIYERGCLHVGLRDGEPRHEIHGERYIKDANGKTIRTYPLLHTWRA